MNYVKSGYVLAGFETLAGILDAFIEGKKGRFNDNFTRKDISYFFENIMTGFLHSFGQNFSKRKKYNKYNKQQAELYEKCRKSQFFSKDVVLLADSGGFQISIGQLTRKESEMLTDLYYKWLVDYPDACDRAFILDVPPGPGCEIFYNFDDVYQFNLKSYLTAGSLPEEIKKKIIYIHHFRTPQLWDIYLKILRENNLFSLFKHHGTGGIVANMSGDVAIPCIIYVLPLIPLINEAKNCGRDYLNFHVLGGATFRDIFFYELSSKLLQERHNIKLTITYDSSGIFKQLLMARFLFAKDSLGNYRKVDIRSNKLHERFEGRVIALDIVEQVLNNMARDWNFREIMVDDLYDSSTETLRSDVQVYCMLYTLSLFGQIQAEMRMYASELFKLYDDGKLDDFYKGCVEVTKILNQGRITKKQKVKTHSIVKSLDMLTTLDEDYCKYVVNKCLAKDEFLDLDKKTTCLTI